MWVCFGGCGASCGGGIARGQGLRGGGGVRVLWCAYVRVVLARVCCERGKFDVHIHTLLAPWRRKWPGHLFW